MPVPLLLRTFHVLGVLRRLDLLQINRLLSYVVQPTSVRMGENLAKGTVNVFDTLELALVGDLETYGEPSLFETFFPPETSGREHLDQLRQAFWRVFKRRALLKHAQRKRPPGAGAGPGSATPAAGNHRPSSGRTRADRRAKREFRLEVFLELLAYVSSFDTDEDGFLTQTQFQECLQETASVDLNGFQARLVEVCDLNGFQHVDCVEMCKLLVPPPPSSRGSRLPPPPGGLLIFTPYSPLDDVARVVAAKSALWEEALHELGREVGGGGGGEDEHGLTL
jgi:hypothetical protein